MRRLGDNCDDHDGDVTIDGVISNVTGRTGNDDIAVGVHLVELELGADGDGEPVLADNLSDGDQSYAIVLTGDNDTTDLRFANVDPPDVSVRNLDYTTKGGFYVSQISGDTDENLNTAFFTVSLSSAPSSDNVTITMATSDHGFRGVIERWNGISVRMTTLTSPRRTGTRCGR